MSFWLVASALQVLFQVFLPYLYRASQLHGGYLPALYPAVGPALAHPQGPADLVHGEELGDSAIRGALRGLLFCGEGLPVLKQSSLKLSQGFAVRV